MVKDEVYRDAIALSAKLEACITTSVSHPALIIGVLAAILAKYLRDAPEVTKRDTLEVIATMAEVTKVSQ